MSEIRVVGSTVPTRGTSDGGFMSPRANREGVIATMDHMDMLAREGRVFGANMGSVTTPLTFLVTAANRPDAWIRVPSGTTIFPISAIVALEDFAGTDTEVDVRIAQNDIGNGTSSAADVGPRTLRTDATITSNCVARQLATGDTTAETNPLSVYRTTVNTANAAGNDLAGRVVAERRHMGYPVLVGPASLEVFVAASTTQATGFVVITWGEVPSTSVA